jgi:hypothetical protein
MDRAHPGQVNHDATVVDGIAGDVVATAPDGEQEVMLTGEIHRLDDIGDPRALGDDGGTAINHAVADLPRLVIPGIAWLKHTPANVRPERLHMLGIKSWARFSGSFHRIDYHA